MEPVYHCPCGVRVVGQDEWEWHLKNSKRHKRFEDALIDEQEPLGSDFEKVWDDNVDKLYKE